MLDSPARPYRYRRFACPLTRTHARLAESRGWLNLRHEGLSPSTFCQFAWHSIHDFTRSAVSRRGDPPRRRRRTSDGSPVAMTPKRESDIPVREAWPRTFPRNFATSPFSALPRPAFLPPAFRRSGADSARIPFTSTPRNRSSREASLHRISRNSVSIRRIRPAASFRNQAFSRARFSDRCPGISDPGFLSGVLSGVLSGFLPDMPPRTLRTARAGPAYCIRLAPNTPTWSAVSNTPRLLHARVRGRRPRGSPYIRWFHLHPVCRPPPGKDPGI